MDRRLFLKSAVTTCGMVIVGIPNISAGQSPVRVHTTIPPGGWRHQGYKRYGCAIPGYRRNQHDRFPQDPHLLQP
jgi:hypothetical protein